MARKTRSRRRTSKNRSETDSRDTEVTSFEPDGEVATICLLENEAEECGLTTDVPHGENELDHPTQAHDECTDSQSLQYQVESNGRLLELLLNRVGDLSDALATQDGATANGAASGDAAYGGDDAYYQQQIDEYEGRITELERQNEELASRVASDNVRKTVACADSGSNDALSWEDRKRQILEQMEDDAFDAESFVSDLQQDAGDDGQPLDAEGYLDQLHSEQERLRDELNRRDDEVQELRHLLEQQSGTREGGVAVGAAAIAQMVDSDELVQQERERLSTLQEQWEEKFRQGEIELSLERAKLSRERLELARKNSELEEQLERLRREAETAESGAPSRRWLAKLGLSDSGS